jgi:hypothetical protein
MQWGDLHCVPSNPRRRHSSVMNQVGETESGRKFAVKRKRAAINPPTGWTKGAFKQNLNGL